MTQKWQKLLLHAYNLCLCSAKLGSQQPERFMQMFWYCSVCVCVYTPLALQGKVSFGINSLSQEGYTKDQLSCSSCALNFNNPPNTEVQQPGVPKLCWPVDKNQLVTT